MYTLVRVWRRMRTYRARGQYTHAHVQYRSADSDTLCTDLPISSDCRETSSRHARGPILLSCYVLGLLLYQLYAGRTRAAEHRPRRRSCYAYCCI